jgi:WD40 repeat protein
MHFGVCTMWSARDSRTVDSVRTSLLVYLQALTKQVWKAIHIVAIACLSNCAIAQQVNLTVPTQSDPPPIREIGKVTAHEGAVQSLSLSPDGEFVVSLGADNIVRAWRIARRKLSREFKSDPPEQFHCIALSPDKAWVLAAGDGSEIVCWRSRDGQPRNFAVPNGNIRRLAWSPESKYFASADEDGIVRIWDVATGKQMRERAYDVPPSDLCYSRTGNTLYAVLPEKGLAKWRQDGEESGDWVIEIHDPSAMAVNRMSQSLDGEFICTTTPTRELNFWNVRKQGIHEIQCLLPGVMVTAFSPSAEHLIAFGGNGAVAAWTIDRSTRVMYHKADDKGVTAVALADGGRRAATGHDDGSVRFWEIAEPPPVGDVQTDFENRLRQLRRDENFEALDQEAESLRKSQARLPGGLPKLELFYELLAVPPESTDEGWQAHLDRLNKWVETRPDSATARIALGAALIGHAWYARGGGFAGTVTEEGWEQFGKRLDAAREHLEAAAKMVDDDPGVYHYMLSVAKGQGWESQKTRAVFERAIAIDPEYVGAYLTMAEILMPRWQGEPGELELFALQTASRLKGDAGEEMYFRIACRVWFYEGELLFVRTKFPYERVRDAGIAMLRRRPETFQSNRPLHHLCRFACDAGDVELARELFVDLGNSWWDRVWGSKEGYMEERENMLSDDPFLSEVATVLSTIRDGLNEPAPAPKQVVSPPSGDPGSDKIVCEPVEFLDPETGANGTGFELSQGSFDEFAFSADSQLMVLTGDGSPVRVWRIGDRQVIDRTDIEGAKFTSKVEISPDADLIAMVSRPPQEPPSAILWNRAEKTRRVLATSEDLGNRGMAMSPDGQFVAVGIEKRIHIWPIADLENPTVLEGSGRVKGLKYSIDGESLFWVEGRTIVIGNPTTGERISEWESGDISVQEFGVVGDKNLLYTAASGRTDQGVAMPGRWIRKWNVATKEPLQQFEIPYGVCPAIAWSLSDTVLAYGNADGTIVLRRTSDQSILATIPSRGGLIRNLKLSPDATRLFAAGSDYRAWLWDVSSITGAAAGDAKGEEGTASDAQGGNTTEASE